jgi:hypothetical protein
MDQPNRDLRDESPQRALSAASRLTRYRRESLKFLINLIETDPTALAESARPGDLPNLIFDLKRFGLVLPEGEPQFQLERFTRTVRSRPDLLSPAIASVTKLLVAAADDGKFRFKMHPDTELVFDGAGNSDAQRLTLLSPANPEGLVQAITVRAAQYLSSAEGKMIRRCAREACKRIFLAARPKQIFCGRPCASAVAFVRYKHDLGSDEYSKRHNKSAREAYRHKQRLLGRKVKPRIRKDSTAKGM